MCVCLCVVCATLTWQAAVGSQWTFQFFIDALCENCCRRQFIWEYFHCDSPSALLFIFSRFDFNEMCLISSARTKLQLAKAFCWCASKSSDAKVLPAMMMRATCTTTNVEYKVLWICTEYSKKVHKERCFQIFRRYLYIKQDNKPKYTCWSFWILYQ